MKTDGDRQRWWSPFWITARDIGEIVFRPTFWTAPRIYTTFGILPGDVGSKHEQAHDGHQRKISVLVPFLRAITKSFVAQRFDHIQPGGLPGGDDRRQRAKKQTNGDG